MTPDEKIEFAKAGGWLYGHYYPEGHGWLSPDLGTYPNLPDFDTNLQACFDVLERFCSERHLLFELGQQIGSGYYAAFDWHDLSAFQFESDTHFEHGETKQEAIQRAVLSAVRTTSPTSPPHP